MTAGSPLTAEQAHVDRRRGHNVCALRVLDLAAIPANAPPLKGDTYPFTLHRSMAEVVEQEARPYPAIVSRETPPLNPGARNPG